MDKKKENEDVSPVLGVLVIVLGGLAFWWWQLGEEGRRGWLGRIGRESGYGRAPADMLGQLEWLLSNRVEDLQGMFLLFVLMSAAGAVEGNAQRQAVTLAGFGLRRLRNGRVLMLAWAGLTAACLVVPVALPYREVSLGLAGLLLLAMYTVGRGLRRVH
ncbi:MAG: hypothetical protein OXP66_05360 [Candidatus Tectomicrobia bacterium]|nr:hypothetical protein [Candidatus Tectomicrobia bacterium]